MYMIISTHTHIHGFIEQVLTENCFICAPVMHILLQNN